MSASAFVLVDTVLPVGNHTISEYFNRVAPTFELLAELDKQRADCLAALLNRMRAGTNSARDVRKVLNEYGWPVMATVIPMAESYAQAAGADLARC